MGGVCQRNFEYQRSSATICLSRVMYRLCWSTAGLSQVRSSAFHMAYGFHGFRLLHTSGQNLKTFPVLFGCAD